MIWRIVVNLLDTCCVKDNNIDVATTQICAIFAWASEGVPIRIGKPPSFQAQVEGNRCISKLEIQ